MDCVPWYAAMTVTCGKPRQESCIRLCSNMHMGRTKNLVVEPMTLSWTIYMVPATRVRVQLESSWFARRCTKQSNGTNTTNTQIGMLDTTTIHSRSTNTRSHNSHKTSSKQNTGRGKIPMSQRCTKTQIRRGVNHFRCGHPTARRSGSVRQPTTCQTPLTRQRAYV